MKKLITLFTALLVFCSAYAMQPMGGFSEMGNNASSSSTTLPFTNTNDINGGIGSVTPPSVGDADGNRLTPQALAPHWTATKAEETRLDSRRVETLITGSEDLENAAFSIDSGGTINSATQATFDGTADVDLLQNHTIVDNGAGRTFIISIDIALISGTVSADDAVQLKLSGNAIQIASNTNADIGTELTSTAKRFTVYGVTDAAGTIVTPHIRVDDSITISATKWLLEESTGRIGDALTTPSEYVSSTHSSVNASGVQYFNNENTNIVIGNIVHELTAGGNYAGNSYHNGVATNHITSSDVPEITGDIDIRVLFSNDDYTPSNYVELVNKLYTTGQYGYDFYLSITTGALTFRYSTNGTDLVTTQTNALANYVDDGVPVWARVTRSSSTGDINFYYSFDGEDWNLIIGTYSTTPSAINNGSDTFALGGAANNILPLTGKIYRSQIFDEIDGENPVIDFNPGKDSKEGDTSFTSSTGETYNAAGLLTFHKIGSSIGRNIISNNGLRGDATVIEEGSNFTATGDYYARFNGVSGDYIGTPDSSALDIVSDIEIIAKLAMDDYTPPFTESVIGKWLNTGNQRSYLMQVHTDGTVFLFWSEDGAVAKSAQSTTATGLTDGSINWLKANRSFTTGVTTFYTSQDGNTWTQLGDTVTSATSSIYSSSATLDIGAHSIGASARFNGEIYQAQIYSGIDENRILVANFNAEDNPINESTHIASSTGETWTWTDIANGRDVEGWSESATASAMVVDGDLRVTNTTAAISWVDFSITTEIGKRIEMWFNFDFVTSGIIRAGSTLGGSDYANEGLAADGVYRYVFTPTTTTTYIRYYTNSSTLGAYTEALGFYVGTPTNGRYQESAGSNQVLESFNESSSVTWGKNASLTLTYDDYASAISINNKLTGALSTDTSATTSTWTTIGTSKFTAGASVAVSVEVRNVNSNRTALLLWNATGAAQLGFLSFDWSSADSTGVPSAVTETNISNTKFERLSDDRWRISFLTTASATATDNHIFYVYPSYNTTANEEIQFGSVEAVENTYLTSPIISDGSATTRLADVTTVLDQNNWPSGSFSVEFKLTPTFDVAAGLSAWILRLNSASRGIYLHNSAVGRINFYDGTTIGLNDTGYMASQTIHVKMIADDVADIMYLSVDGVLSAEYAYDGDMDVNQFTLLHGFPLGIYIKDIVIHPFNKGLHWMGDAAIVDPNRFKDIAANDSIYLDEKCA